LLLDESGEPCLTLNGIETLEIPTRDEDAQWLTELTWEPIAAQPPVSPAQRRWLILADHTGLGANLARLIRSRGDEVTILETPVNVDWRAVLDDSRAPAEIVHLWSLDQQSLLEAQQTGSLAVAALIQALTTEPRITLVTQSSQGDAPTGFVQASLWSFFRTLAIEHGEFRSRQIDLDHDTRAETLLEALDAPSPEPECIYRSGRWYAPRLRPAARRALSLQPLRFKEHASYLITGGTGGLGLELARWLISRGARHLVLAAAHPLDDETAPRIEALRNAGAQVRFVCCDLGEADETAELLQLIERDEPPLKGIFHAAGSLRDGLILNMRPAHYYQSFLPKAQGAWLLHELTKSQALDYFVMFSSVASLLGAPGQAAHGAANGFLDGLARYRHSRGLPATSINWGLWGDAGHALKVDSATQLRTTGMDAMQSERGLRLLEQALRGGGPQYGVFRFEAEEWLRHYPSFSLPPMMQALADSRMSNREPVQSSCADRERVAAAPDAEARKHLLEDIVARELSAVLRTPGEKLERARPFNELNLDSLLSLELRSRLEGALSFSLPTAAIWRHPTIERLADFLESGAAR
jgi:NAD(P)-dependent dehydrogenase (short-subunit alcohol dehydrogenase family)/acyl carrier protein